jgi:hypothetical protein
MRPDLAFAYASAMTVPSETHRQSSSRKPSQDCPAERLQGFEGSSGLERPCLLALLPS